MRLVRVSSRLAVLLVAVGVLLAGRAARAWPAPVSPAGAAGGCDWLGVRAAALDSGVLAQSNSAGESGGNNPDPAKEPWERRLEQAEQSRLTAVLVFLGIVIVVLVLWWGWGKLYHRPRKL